MAGNFDLPSWLTTQTPWSGSDAFIKGSQAGSAIAANRIRAKQLYVEVQQYQQKMDLAEREFTTQNEASTLRNEVLRTKLANDAADFETLRTWWPSFQSSEGEIDMPVLRDENTMLKVATAVAEKRSKIGQAAFAELMATPGFDLANPEHQKQYFELLSRYKNIPAKLGPDGVMGPIKVAESLKRLRDEADSRIEARTDRTEYNQAQLRLKQILADHTIPLTDARVLEAQQDAALAERRMLIQEGNLALRDKELNQKGRRLSMRDETSYKNELKALNDEEKAKLKAAELDAPETDRLRKFYNLKRRGITDRFYGNRPSETNAPAAVASPAAAAPKGITKEEYDKLAPGTKYIAPDGTERTKG